MGLLDFLSDVAKSIGNKSQEINEEKNKTYQSAMQMAKTPQNTRRLCHQIDTGGSMGWRLGNEQALKDFLSSLNDNDVKELFMELHGKRSGMIIAAELGKRGYLEKNSEGKWERTYKW